jgi:hypothetical protein
MTPQVLPSDQFIADVVDDARTLAIMMVGVPYDQAGSWVRTAA